MTPRALLTVLLLTAPLLAQSITVDLNTTIVPSFMGLGVQWDPYDYPPSDAAWQQTLARLDFMHPAFFRVMWTADHYCLGFDDSGEPQYAWNLGDQQLEQHLGPLFKILDYAQSRGIDVMLGEWNQPKRFAGPQDPRWPRIIADFVHYLTTRKKYTVIRYYNFFNEPNGNWMWPHGKVNYAAWAAGIRLLRQEFDAQGLQSLPIAGPDNSGNWDWLDRCAHDLHDQIGFWEMHWYAKDQEVFDGDIEKLLRAKREMLLAADPQAAAKNLYMAEAGIIQGRVNGDQQPRVKTFDYGILMADYVAQVARAGWMGASAWDLDDAMHVVNGRDHPHVPDPLTLKIWGFWNTQGAAMGHPEDESPRPWYYAWSWMSRLLPKGARIAALRETSLPPGLRALAASTPNGLSLILVNDSPDAAAITLRIPGYSRKQLLKNGYFELPQDKPLELDRTGAVQLTLPARSIVFLSDTTFFR